MQQGAPVLTRSALLMAGSKQEGGSKARNGWHAGTWDLAQHGLPYALAVGPYGALLALTWQRNAGGAVNLVWIDRQRPGVPPDSALVMYAATLPKQRCLLLALLAGGVRCFMSNAGCCW